MLKSLIHRDIKPGNILIDDSADRPAIAIKVTDFGLAALWTMIH